MQKIDLRLAHGPSPLQAVAHPAFLERSLHLWVKRDDLLHLQISGNKWRKLQHNLLEAHRQGCTKLITFGGAFSNHLAAVAAAGREFGFSTLGVVSGEASSMGNPSLRFAQSCGMELVFTSRASMRHLSVNELLAELAIQTAGAYILPQGGSNCLALPGCAEIVAETAAQLGQFPDYFITASGTGATLAGIATGLPASSLALGVSVLKGGFLQNEVEKLLAACGGKPNANWQVLDGFHHGGYAKWTPELVAFINDFKRKTGVPLDPIYTGKAFFAAAKLAENGFFPEGARVVLVHTGGLQGIAGFNERFGDLILA
jgi:1-aminocyclopropane-1-carboxylate deaminase/D-cysteine desulfhydrase-like pyridoxal-dependent ACC family enzyme